MAFSAALKDKNFLRIEGNSYECGFTLGTLLKDAIKNRLQRNAIDEAAVSRYKRALKETHDFHSTHYQFCLDEIRGMAEGAGEDYWKLLLLNCPHLTSMEQGCTSIVVKDPARGIVLGHNEDGAHGDRPDECVLVEFVQPEGRFFSFVYAGELPGCAYNWNEHHLYVTVNYVPPVKSGHVLISRHVVARALLYARTPEEALAIVQRPQHADGFHYFIGQKDVLYSVEMMGEKISTFLVDALLVHTNHHSHETFSNLLQESEKSKMRYEKSLRLLTEGKSIEEVLFDRESAPTCIYCSTDTIRTLSTAFFYPREGYVQVCPQNTLDGALRFGL